MGSTGVKTCTRCSENKPLAEFARDGRRSDGRSSHCRACRSEEQAERRAELSAETKADQAAAYRAGIRQGRCAVCGTAISGTGICETCEECVDVLGGLEGLKRAVRAVRYLSTTANKV